MKYFIYLAKKRIPVVIAMFLSFLLIFLATNNKAVYMFQSNDGVNVTDVEYRPVDNIFTVYTVCLCIALIITVMFELSFRMKKISQEQLYAMPIKRNSLLLGKVIFAYLEVIAPFLIAYSISAARLLLGYHLYDSIYFLWYPLSMLPLGFLMIGVVAFMYIKANNIIDGVLFVIGSMMILCIIAALLKSMHFYSIDRDWVFFRYAIFAPLDFTTSIFNYYCKGDFNLSYHGLPDHILILGYSISTVYLVLGWIGFIYTIFHDKAENITKRSNFVLGYYTMIPVFTAYFCSLGDWIYFSVSVISVYFLMALYRRSFVLDKKNWIYTASFIGFDILVFAFVMIDKVYFAH